MFRIFARLRQSNKPHFKVKQEAHSKDVVAGTEYGHQLDQQGHHPVEEASNPSETKNAFSKTYGRLIKEDEVERAPDPKEITKQYIDKFKEGVADGASDVKRETREVFRNVKGEAQKVVHDPKGVAHDVADILKHPKQAASKLTDKLKKKNVFIHEQERSKRHQGE